jgi:hypothetical protein
VIDDEYGCGNVSKGNRKAEKTTQAVKATPHIN